MERGKFSWSFARRTAVYFFLSTAVLVAGTACVGLTKPTNVETCAKNGTCSDDPNRRLDAAADSRLSDAGVIPDVRLDAVVPGDTADRPVAIDTGMEDVAPDLRDALPDTRDSAANDLVENVDSTIADQALAEALPGSEAGPEPKPEPAPEPGLDGGNRDSTSGNCINQLISSGYVYGAIPACSACRDNSTSLETKCKGMIDCLKPPRTKADMTYCLNSVGGSQPVFKCVDDLVTAACPAGF